MSNRDYRLQPPCFSTVPEPHLFHPGELRFERKQIPRFVVNRMRRKAMETWEATRLPWAQIDLRGNHRRGNADRIWKNRKTDMGYPASVAGGLFRGTTLWRFRF